MNIRKHIPDSITSMNLLCGVMGVILTLGGRPDWGFILMISGAVFDFFDGFAARMLNASSGIGKELDSLADMVSFGVLPSVMLYATGGSNVLFLKYFPLILAAFSALRLAKFNLDERQHESFLGLPTPSAAMVCGALACYVFHEPDSLLSSWCQGPVFLQALSLGLSLLLVSEIPMFSMKFGGGNKASKTENLKRIIFIAVVLAVVLLVVVFRLHWSLIFLTAFTGYILINLAFIPFGHSERSTCHSERGTCHSERSEESK
ncbi:MAG: CDP-diacylglycerol--serine O-phosphatidyltransferase [Bacteroidales bacterium]|nr:CDP-diacylglycerol--serine O-phosphatidyltransferase [Bacteroidales bacterium]